MGMTEAVHWHEGLFLQPHHLQAHQRYVQGRIVGERRLGWAYPYGLIEARLSADALENGFIQFDRLRLVMPGGLEVNVPDNADLPALSIKEALAASPGSLVLSIGVPHWHAGRANTIERSGAEDWRVTRLYRVAELERADENTGENTQTLLVRRINARLLLPDDDRTDLETLPIARVTHGVGEDVGIPRVDPRYIPPCMLLSGSPTLREQMRDLANQIEASRTELVAQMTRGGFSVEAMRGVQFEQMMRLRTLNRFAGSLGHLVAAANVAPFDLYLQLRELLGELAALRPDNDQFEVSRYDHDNPALAFQELQDRIRGLVRGAVTASFVRVDFKEEEGILVASMTDEHIERPTDYFLGIRTSMDATVLARLVEDADKFKFMVRSMAQRRAYGIRLVEERHPPHELPADSSLHYFRLMRADSMRMWERIKEEREVAIVCRELKSEQFQAALYMTMPMG